MANRLSKEKANLIASIYCTNGYKKVEALLEAGYKPSYANSSRGLNLYDNTLVKSAINRIEAGARANTDITVAYIQAEHKRLKALCEAKQDYVTATRNLEGEARTIGGYKDNLNTTLEQPETIEAEDIEQLRAIADKVTTIKLKKA